jgi:hypothetical protein
MSIHHLKPISNLEYLLYTKKIQKFNNSIKKIADRHI